MFSDENLIRAWFKARQNGIDRQLEADEATRQLRHRLLRDASSALPMEVRKAMKSRAWLAFGALSVIWGSSFLWIKIAVQELGPFRLVALRLLFGVIGLLIAGRLTKQPLRLSRKQLPAYLVLALFNTALPFTLISWGETRIDSGMASVLNGTVPLFTLVIAHFWLQDERITLPRTLGLLIGFGGVAVLVGQNFDLSRILEGSSLGQLAVLAASASYATGLTLTRKQFRGRPPVTQATLVVLLSDLILWAGAFAFESPVRLPGLSLTWIALLWLGFLGTGLAYLLYFYLINEWGSTRTSVVTYTMPVIGVILGVVFLQESLSVSLILGVGLVLTGIGFVNWKHRRTVVAAPAEPELVTGPGGLRGLARMPDRVEGES
ncbi:MAG TPA: DMT family transporter [Anaerolineales bacterium]|nr:DMT family transporter [Anaerolineales bacterium]